MRSGTRSWRALGLAVAGAACLVGWLLTKPTVVERLGFGPARPPARAEDWPGIGPTGSYRAWEQRRFAFWWNRRKDHGAVAFCGDSIIQGWGDALPAAFPTLRVANRGITGDTSRRLLWRIGPDALDLQPRGVVLLVGINDLLYGVPPAHVARNIAALLDRIQREAPGTPVVLCQVLPHRTEPGRFPERIVELNRRLRTLTGGRANVTLCDTWTPFATPHGSVRPEEFPDGLHPNERAYPRLADALRPALRRAGLL